jgi:hypothetical protein
MFANPVEEALLGGVAVVVYGSGYIFPTIIAAVRKKTTLAKIALVNVLLGWTLAGWGIALYWALNGDDLRGKAGPTL